MLIHVDALTSRSAPIQIYQFDEVSGCLLVGDAGTRILLDRKEIAELYRLLQPFVKDTDEAARQ